MEIFIFDGSLEAGIELIDEQHRKIIEAANMFFVCFDNGHANRMAPQTIYFLESYILYHFNAEEAFQVDSGYPRYREHQAEHSYLATQVKFHAVTLAESNYSYDAAQNFHTFFKAWIVNHILERDMDFAHFYKKKRKGATEE